MKISLGTLSLLFSAVLATVSVPAQAQPCAGSWQKMTVTAGPSARYGAAMAYDGATGASVLFGGLDANGVTLRGETWVWNGVAWTQVATTGPGGRLGHAMAYDAGRGRIVLFGGAGAGPLKNDTWEWNGSAWTNVTPAGAKPSPRADAAMAYDSGRGRTVLFGGFNSNQTLGDTWEWNGSAWTQVATTGPPPRQRAALAYDPIRHVTILFGGGAQGDTWEWNGIVWTQRSTAAAPSPRSSASLAYHSGCARTLLFGGEGGGHKGDTWGWDGTVWTQLASAGPSPRTQQAMTFDGDRGRLVLFGGSSDQGIVNDTWEWVSSCDDEEAALDAHGQVVFPPNLDTSDPPTYEDVEQNLGDLKNLYPAAGSDLDTWYPGFTCNPAIGGSVPPQASNPDLAGELAAEGIIGATPQDIVNTLEGLQNQIAAQAAQEPDMLRSGHWLIKGSYSPPAVPHCAESGCGYVFGGRDIVFVHGLRLQPLKEEILGTNPGAFTTWPQDRAAFYGSGYWKQGAESYWEDHIQKFLTDRGMRNRYLIVAYPATQRLEVGVQAILTQIADAMRTGVGVVDPTGRNNVAGFGTPSFVIVSHSTGGLITDVALAAAAQNPALGVGFIPRFCKAHIAMHAVFSGSRLATAAVALSGFVTVTSPPTWLCPLANLGLAALGPPGGGGPALPCTLNFSALSHSILVDLVPLVAQNKWGSYVASTPVRTLTVVGAHPSMYTPLKHLLLLGDDDGVSSVESQDANPNSVLMWPSGFNPVGPFDLVKVFDMGVGKSSPLRATGYYRDQVIDRLLNPLSAGVASGPTPYVSATGMVQPVGLQLSGSRDPLNRYPKHYSFLFSAADHYGGSTGPFNGDDYRSTFAEPNREETRVLTDPAVFQNFTMVYPGDDGPLLTHAQTPAVEEIVRGRKVHFKIKIFGHKYEKTWWIWKRRYHLLAGSQNKTQMDYLYGSVLTQSIPLCPPPSAANDCNHNGVADVCDVSNGTSHDCNHNEVPDECEAHLTPQIVLQPIAQTQVAGQAVTFSVTVNGFGPFSYQWRRNGVNLVDGGAVSGAKTNQLVINPVALGDSGVYDVVVSSGCGQTTSLQVNLIVQPCVLDPGLVQAGSTAPVHAVLAQTFQPSHSGTLTRIVHGLRNGGSGSVQSYNLYVTTTTGGKPSWPAGVLYSATGLTIFASGSLVDGTVAVANGPHLSAGTTYALVLEPIGSGDLYWRGNSGGGSYPNGAAFQKAPGNAPWQPNGFGPKDFGFRLEGNCD